MFDRLNNIVITFDAGLMIDRMIPFIDFSFLLVFSSLTFHQVYASLSLFTFTIINCHKFLGEGSRKGLIDFNDRKVQDEPFIKIKVS